MTDINSVARVSTSIMGELSKVIVGQQPIVSGHGRGVSRGNPADPARHR